MDEAGETGGKRRNGLSILLGVIGAVVGYVGLIALLALIGFGNPHDPITTGLTALFLVGPIGAVAGIFLGAKLGAMIGARRGAAAAGEGAVQTAAAAPSVGRNALKAAAIVVGAIVVIGGGYAFNAYQTATPWLHPANSALQFEVRLPAGAAMPAGEVKAELQTSVNAMPADMKPALYRRDGDQPVIVGQIWLAYRTNQRQIEVKIPGRMDRTYQLKLKDSPPHMPQFGAWDKHPDGSEIRYRVRWAGQD